MGNKERLKGILERLAAAAERERLDEEEASAKAEKVKSVRVEVIQEWQEQRAHLKTFIQLFIVQNPRHAPHWGEHGSGQNGGRIPSTHAK
jgi:hypothetical protein